jgi:hypothetical protein
MRGWSSKRTPLASSSRWAAAMSGAVKYRRAGMIEFRFLGDIEHQAHPAAVEEG